MTDKIFHFVMVPMVYLAVAIFAVGALFRVVRILTAPRHPAPLRTFPLRKFPHLSALYDTFFMPQVRSEKPLFWFWLMLYHIAFLLLFLAHLDLIPGVNLMPPDSPHMLGWGAVGVALTASTFYFMFRRLKSPVRDVSTFGDYLILLLLLFVFVTGDTISWANSWNENGFVLAKEDFGNYAQLLVSFSFENPRDVLDSSHYVVVVIHVLLANLLLMIFPFTKVMHTFLALPINRLRRV